LPQNHAAIPTFGYLPFGRGPRQCIGSQIARRAITLAAAELLANFEIVLDRRRPMEVRGGYSLLFTHGLHVTARPLAA
jgi:cytochrome P450